MVIAHRGASREAPGNTEAAFQAAIEAGADAVELDVRQTADSVLVVHHSAARRGVLVSRLTYAELVRRSRHRPPTLAQALRLCAGRTTVDIEIKDAGYEAATLEVAARELGTSPAFITSFHPGVIETVKALQPERRCGLLVGVNRMRSSRARAEQSLVDAAVGCGADFIAPHQLLVGLRPHSPRRRAAGSPLLAAAAAAGLPAMVWTVNGAERLRHFLGERGVTGIITDLPALALEIRSQLVTVQARPPFPGRVRPIRS